MCYGPTRGNCAAGGERAWSKDGSVRLLFAVLFSALPGACIAPGLAADIVPSTDARRWYGN
jgi:hypothetical protein